MKTTKKQFYQILDSLKDFKDYGYWYSDKCNDHKSQERYQPKSANYEFFITGKEEILLESGSFFKSNHKIKKQELIKRFSNWVKQYIKNK